MICNSLEHVGIILLNLPLLSLHKLLQVLVLALQVFPLLLQ